MYGTGFLGLPVKTKARRGDSEMEMEMEVNSRNGTVVRRLIGYFEGV